MKAIREVAMILIPKRLRPSMRNYMILNFDYGHLKSVRVLKSVDRNGNAIPWFTYPAIEYLKGLDLRQKTIFEFGSGNSTLFWARNASKVVSVEDDASFYNQMKASLPANVEYLLIQDEEEYAKAVMQYESAFDVIVIDGSHRHECARTSISKIRSDGLIILDNSDWFVETTALLRSANFIQVDLTGLGPVLGFVWSTSFFFQREFAFRPLHDSQPVPGIGCQTLETGIRQFRGQHSRRPWRG